MTSINVFATRLLGAAIDDGGIRSRSDAKSWFYSQSLTSM